ncbi:hypothetical protein Ancab_036330 [Ancistrocladus abbreviatus]
MSPVAAAVAVQVAASGGGAGGGGGQFGDTTYTKVFVGGLAWETQKETMKKYFEQFGEILEAVVITDKATGRSKGYGFVTFREPEAAMRACVDPTPVIDGRRANCNLASLGVQRSKPSTPKHAGGRNMRTVSNNNYQTGYGGGGGLGAAFPAVAAAAVAASFPHYAIQQGIPFPNLYGYSAYSPDYSYPTSYYGVYGGGATQYSVFGAAGSGGMMSSATTGFYPYMQFGEGSGGTAAAATNYSTTAGQSYGFHYQPHNLYHYSSSAFPQHYGPAMSLAPTTALQSGMTTMAINAPIPHR